MLEAKVIFFTDNETHNWFEQFLKTRVPCRFLCLVGLEKLTKGEKKGARGEEADEKKKGRNKMKMWQYPQMLEASIQRPQMPVRSAA